MMKQSLQTELSNFIKNWESERKEEKRSPAKDDSKLQKQFENLSKERNTLIMLNKDRLNEVNYWRKKFQDLNSDHKNFTTSNFNTSKGFNTLEDITSRKFEAHNTYR